jgi:hypothetical protein
MILVLCPFCSLDTPPIGVAILLSVLRRRGHEATARDLNAELFHSSPPSLQRCWDGQKVLDLIDADRFNSLLPELEPLLIRCTDALCQQPARFIGFSVFRTNLRFSVEVARRVKARAPERTVIFGGPSCDIPGERAWITPGCADALVTGEAEEVLPSLLAALDSDRPDEIPAGTMLAPDGDPYPQLPRNRITDLDSVPVPDFSGLDLTLYRRQPYLPIAGSRGCIMHCAYCNDHILTRPYRCRSARSIFDELQHQHHYLGATAFVFNDLLINGNLRVLEELAEMILDAGLQLSWIGQAVPRADMRPKLMEKLAAAGLEMLTFGVESGSPRILGRMGKRTTLIDTDHALRVTHDAGIRTAINLMVGFPGESEEEFQETLALVSRNQHLIDEVENIHPLFVSPMSPMESNPGSFGIVNLGDTPVERAIRWHDVTGVTYEVRGKRVRLLARLLDSLDMVYDPERLNLLDG